MLELFSLLSIGIALSMDTFSLSLGIGTLLLKQNKILLVSSIVGIMHFIMPLLGFLLGKQILNIFIINPNFLVSIILIFIAFMMIKDLKEERDTKFTLTFLGILFFAFSVSLDSFSTGIGLKALTSNNFKAAIIFALCSISFTFLGLTIGKYSKEKLGKYANILGIILLIIVALLHLFG